MRTQLTIYELTIQLHTPTAHCIKEKSIKLRSLYEDLNFFGNAEVLDESLSRRKISGGF